MRAANHDYSDPEKPFIRQGHLGKKVTTCDGEEASIIIGDDVWIGVNCIGNRKILNFSKGYFKFP